MDYDVVIIGGGPSGFGTAIKLAQIFKETNQDKTICVLEKSAEIGGHILSGNVFQTTALDELFPDWKDKDAPVKVEVKKQPGEDEDCDDGEEVLKDILKPKISSSYQEEIDKLEDMIKMIKTFPISDDPDKKDQVIDQLKNTLAILMTQSKNLIKEMQQMSRRNSYFKNNIILAAFILDKCRKDVPETEEEFDNMFN